ncbi:phasin family protein [Methylobacterium nonmethylotrophicum]|uniref:Phasin family protein n=1 Tax=Methylobacterium nonmethylotrophicum TaxID=1141884 RepID=A0A4Z0NV12_9HYPH|nr:phasin family protein [Methylobacterium nonmethylotrophicum]TGE01161.1 phasin family protein [Methylobacterium nonmethylotrophicum]
MAATQHSEHAKKIEPLKAASDGATNGIENGAAQASRMAELAKDSIDKAGSLQGKTADNAQQIMQMSVETVSRTAREFNEQLARTMGVGSEDGERFAAQARQNTDAVSRCGTVMTHAAQDAWRSSVELGQKRWQRNLEGLKRLAGARSVQEFSMLQSEMMRESVQSLVEDARILAEKSLRTFEEVGQICASVKPLPAAR